MTSRWIDLTWQPPSNADSLGNDLLGYRVYVEELCDHHTSHQYRRLRQREATAAMQANAASDGTAAAAVDLVPQRMGKCREISPETVHGASSLMASFHNLGNYIYYSFLNMILKDTIYIILDLDIVSTYWKVDHFYFSWFEFCPKGIEIKGYFS